MDIEIRRAGAADADALGALDREGWNTLTSPSPPPGPEWTFFDEKTRPENVLVAVADGEIAGYVRLVRATPLAASDHVSHINGFTVAGSQRRRGVGRALLAAAVAEARARGARRVTLRVLAHNEPAKRVYEAAGFKVEGILRGEFFLDGVYVDDVCMALEL